MANPKSPLTKKNNTVVADIFLVKDIIQLYKDQLNIDVNRFFAGEEKIFLYRDNETGYRFYHPETIAGDGKFYEHLQNKLGDEYYHPWKFENQLAYDLINKDDKVLDIGCGIGNFLMRAREKTRHVFGIELNENAVTVCRTKGLTVFNELIQEHAKNRETYYDVVCSFQVLEHIYDVKDFLDSALKVLKKDGKLVIGVPNNEPFFLGYDKYCTLNLPPHHMGLWNKNVFEKMSNPYNLRLLKTQYDTKGSIITEAYTRAKYFAGVKSLAGKHSIKEKLMIFLFGVITAPLSVFKKIAGQLHGSHIAIVFQKK